ncbi:hypothetical protein ACFU53_14525 [Streptomyces sp. NPDC057474]
MFGSAIRLRDLDGDGDKDLLAASLNGDTACSSGRAPPGSRQAP